VVEEEQQEAKEEIDHRREVISDLKDENEEMKGELLAVAEKNEAFECDGHRWFCLTARKMTTSQPSTPTVSQQVSDQKQ
jgi:hypothetical protein